MTKKSASYDTGKAGEKSSWDILDKKGFVRPTTHQRKVIIKAFEANDIQIKSRGFDCLNKNELKNFMKNQQVQDLTLYELKTAGKDRKNEVGDNFKNLGFTLTSSEKHNADLLGEKYKFIFLNLKNENHGVYSLKDFFTDEISRIYETWSIFIEKDIQ